MNRGATVLAGALLMIILPSQALAQQAGCRTIRAITNADRRDFADLRIGVGSGALTLRAGSRTADLEGPAECAISSVHDQRSIDCRWRFFDQAQAAAYYEPLLTRMRACLADTMQQGEIPARTDGWLVTRRHEALLAAEYSQTKVALSLVDATGRSDPQATPNSNHYVQLTVEFEQGD